MGTLWRDFRYGFRMLARNKGFTAVAILALALGIGPNVAMFSIIYATFLSPLPYPNADQLVVLWPMVKGERSAMRADDFVQYQAQSKSFQCMGFSSWSVLYLTNPDHTDDEANVGLPNTPDRLHADGAGADVPGPRLSIPMRDLRARTMLLSSPMCYGESTFIAIPIFLARQFRSPTSLTPLLGFIGPVPQTGPE